MEKSRRFIKEIYMKTIIYYSSNQEDPRLEKNVKENILKYSGGLPIISVTQKPIDFGKNISVGDIGVSGFNMFRQVQIALQEVKTEFVISTEADCLYPPDYFKFIPKKNNVCYRTSNLYVMPDKRNFYFHKKEGATHAQIIGRDFYLNRLKILFMGAPMWSTEEINFPRERHHRVDIFDEDEIEHYESENPVVQIKTHKGMRYYTRSDRNPIYNLPFWEGGVEFRKKYYEK
jgi:hypothetical protein